MSASPRLRAVSRVSQPGPCRRCRCAVARMASIMLEVSIWMGNGSLGGRMPCIADTTCSAVHGFS